MDFFGGGRRGGRGNNKFFPNKKMIHIFIYLSILSRLFQFSTLNKSIDN